MLLQPITLPFSKSTLKPSVYTLTLIVERSIDSNYLYNHSKFMFVTENVGSSS